MIESAFDWRQQREGGTGSACADGPELLADEELLRRYREARVADALAAMVHRHRPMILRTCLRLAGNLHDAEDAAQTVFLVLAQRPEVVRRSLAGCLHGLARAAVSELHRSRRRRTERETEAALIRSIFTRLRRGSQPVAERELREELDVALAELPDPLQQAVILRYLEGLSQEEAAQRAGCTTTAMGWRSMKGLQRLRGALSRRGAVVSAGALAAVLGVEAGAAAPGFAGAAGPASAVALGLAAALLKRMASGGTLLKVVVALLLTAGAALGAVVVVAPSTPPTSPAPPNPTQPAPAGPVREANPAPAPAFGCFDRSLDIGGPARAGGTHLAADVYTVRGGGGDIYGKADQFHFVCRPWTGDGEIVARVHSDPDQEGRQVYAGVMFRAGLTPDSHHVALLVEPNGTCHLNYRDAANPASACERIAADKPGKYWVRLVRRGNTFTAYTRPDGAQGWKLVKELEVPLRGGLYVGLAVTARDDAQLATTTIDHVAVRGEK